MVSDATQDRLHVACVSNAAYIPHFAALMNSIAASNPPSSLCLHLVHDGTVAADVQAKLLELAGRSGMDIDFIEPPESVLAQVPPRNWHYPALVYFKVLLPLLLPDLTRVLYIDVDTLVMQDLRPLWSVDLGGALFAAVAQYDEGDQAIWRRERLNLERDAPYLNSGVLLMDLELMRKRGTMQMVLAAGRDQSERLAGDKMLHLPDQDALNEACAGQWLPLHPRWNTLAAAYLDKRSRSGGRGGLDVAEAVASPAIVHFEGLAFVKPWNYRCVHPLQPLYLAYRRNSPWPLERLEDSGLKWRLLALFPPAVEVWLARFKRTLFPRGG